MNSIVMRERKSVLVIGIICTLFFAVPGIFFAITENGLAILFFLPFILLGTLIILIYCRHYIILETNQMTVSEPFKKKRVIRYDEIGTVLIHTTNANMAVILLNHQRERLLKFEMNMTNIEKAVDILEDREIPCMDLSAMTESDRIKAYFPVLTKVEQFIYHPLLKAMENTGTVIPSGSGRKIEKEKKVVKIMGWVMIGIDIFAFIIGKGKPSYICFVFVLLLAWSMYIWMYPNLFLEVSPTIRDRKYLIQMPFLGIAASALFCLLTLDIFNFNFGSYLAFIGVYTVILLIPFVLKLYFIKQKPDKLRLFLIALAVLTLAFITGIPVNYLTTFQGDGHETVTITDKRISRGKTTSYYVYADWQEDNQKFSVSSSEYEEFQKGDSIRVCLRHSIFGFHYWTVHK